MASIDLGRVKFVWKGNYDIAVTYKQDDVVYHSGSLGFMLMKPMRLVMPSLMVQLTGTKWLKV